MSAGAPKAAPPPGTAEPRPPVWLWGAVAALLGVAALLAGTHAYIRGKIEAHPQGFNVYPLPEKLLGLALQGKAFADPTLLPVYGSSELTQPEINRPDDFFRANPTGFGAFLIGNPGETCLMITSKLAAANPAETRGRKAVVFLSPGWFIAPELDHPGFGVNFSPLHGGVFAFESRLTPGLKQDIAKRLLDYPDIIAKYPLLKAGLTCLAVNTSPRRALLASLAPVAAVHNRVQRELDYARLGLWWWHDRVPSMQAIARADRRSAPIDWDARLRDAVELYDRKPAATAYCVEPASAFDSHRLGVFTDPQHPGRAADENYTRWSERSKEWVDYRLMLRTARELGISLLVVCQPINANYSRLQGVGDAPRAEFYRKLRAETEPFPARLALFPAEAEDPHFFRDANHPTARGWLIYNRAIDEFYHAKGD